MTASSGEQNTKRPNGFSIDSIIGKQSEKPDNVKNPCSNNNSKGSDVFVSSQSSSDRHEGFRTTSSTKDKKELSYGIHHHNNSVSSSSRETSNISPLSPSSRTRDDFTSAIHPSARDSLKDLHEVLAQTAGATGTYMSPRLCRHPLSALNLHSIYPSHLQQASPIHPLVLNSARDIRHLHPWLSERYPSHYYYPRYPVGAAPGFLFQPYRKPKRIRTAFSPSQLLQLEKAFEKSHYVVGQERKDLAAELQLTETQVKVWFQNRRTKHKRMKAEEEGGISSPGSHGNMALSKLNMSDSDSEISDINDDEEDGHMICVSSNGLS